MDFKPLSEVKDRREFHEAFQGAMGGAHQNLRALWHFERDQNLPKTYLIEFHPAAGSCQDHKWTPAAVFSAFERAKTHHDLAVKRTEDETLLFLENSNGKERSEFIVDCLDARFLAFHTLSKATVADSFIHDSLTRYEPEFDMFWLPVQLLEDVAKRELVTGWEVRYDPLVDVDDAGPAVAVSNEMDDGSAEEEDVEPPARSLRRPRVNMELEHPEAFDKYKRLVSADGLLPDMPLNAIDAERLDEHSATYARARIKSNGKMTGRGPDFAAYLQIVNGTLDSYSSIVRALESKYWLKVDGGQRDDVLDIFLSGEPFSLKFSRCIDVNALARHMFDCKRPFRLMGEPRTLERDYVVCDAIDLHVNQRVGFEIAPSFMRIYLYDGTCGNTLIRIIRSLQHFVDSKLKHPLLEAS
ncbi:MAG TPA: hypothetical protein VJX67_01275 [Blastocatellia bacterium]|nr:hypothetical protein [Blastocatellia bacterium]